MRTSSANVSESSKETRGNVSSELLLDAWPILEWLKNREPAATLFQEIVEDTLASRRTLTMSRINHGEVLYSIRKTLAPNQVEASLAALAGIPIILYSVDDLLIEEAVGLKSVYSISYADAFAAALALRRNVSLVTGDREFRPLLNIGLKLHWVGA